MRDSGTGRCASFVLGGLRPLKMGECAGYCMFARVGRFGALPLSSPRALGGLVVRGLGSTDSGYSTLGGGGVGSVVSATIELR